MKGYKATNKDMSCQPQFDLPPYQYTMDTKHILENGKVEICSNGFHYCEKLENILYYYNCPSMRVFEILAEGDINSSSEYIIFWYFTIHLHTNPYR